jgi:hypothetical protein
MVRPGGVCIAGSGEQTDALIYRGPKQSVLLLKVKVDETRFKAQVRSEEYLARFRQIQIKHEGTRLKSDQLSRFEALMEQGLKADTAARAARENLSDAEALALQEGAGGATVLLAKNMTFGTYHGNNPQDCVRPKAALWRFGRHVSSLGSSGIRASRLSRASLGLGRSRHSFAWGQLLPCTACAGQIF